MRGGGPVPFFYVHSCLIAEEQRQLLQRAGFTKIRCINYLDPEMAKGEEGRADWQHRK
jgi:hypothetical protein